MALPVPVSFAATVTVFSAVSTPPGPLVRSVT
jgi:hypothetical protein